MSSQREEEAHSPRLEAVIQVGHTVFYQKHVVKKWSYKRRVQLTLRMSRCHGGGERLCYKKRAFLIVTPVTSV